MKFPHCAATVIPTKSGKSDLQVWSSSVSADGIHPEQEILALRHFYLPIGEEFFVTDFQASNNPPLADNTLVMSHFVKNHKRSLIVLGLLVVATIFSALAAYYPNITPNSAAQPTTNTPTGGTASVVVPTKTTDALTTTLRTDRDSSLRVGMTTDKRDSSLSLRMIGGQVGMTNEVTTDTEKIAPNITTTAQQFLSAQMVVGDRTYQLRFTTGEKLIDTMKKLQAMSDQPFSMTTKEYAGMGKFVEDINGIKNNTTAGEYWGYYIDGISAQIGASSYILKEGDNIEWKYAKTTF